MKVTIYHNPRCSKSRQTLELIRDKGVEPEIIEYLKSPPNAADLNNILNTLNMQPRELIRKQETEYKLAGLDDPNLDRAALIQGMVENPKIIERPIVLVDEKAALGRPPENVLEIF